jgi:hypothetical protein
MGEQPPLLSGTGPGDTAVVGRREVVFYESSVAGYQALLAGAAPGTDQVVLDAHDDGLHEMAAFLAGHRGYDAVAVVAHGASGELALGTTRLDADTLAGYGPDLATLGAALNPGGDLLLYGCDVAAGPAGTALVENLAQATAANVAASSHLVGASALHGSWQLDYQTGPIDTGLPFAAEGFQGVLDLGNQQNREGDTVALAVPFSGSAGPLYFTSTALPPGLSLVTLDNVTAQIQGTTSAGAADGSPYPTTVTASDVPPGQYGTYSHTQAFNWAVTPRITIASIADQSSTEGDAVSLDIPASSPDSAPLTFTADGLPPGLSLATVDAHTARITGAVAAHAADNAPYDVTITATDGTYSARQYFSWDLADNPPNLTVGPDLTVAAGTTVTLQASATAPSGIASVSWQVSYDGEDYQDTSLTTLTPQYTFTTFGDYDLLVTVTDNNGETSEASIHATVTEVAPSSTGVTATPNTVVRGNPVTFTVPVADPDALDTVTVYADWEGSGTFDQVNDAQPSVGANGTFYLTFSHVYLQPSTYNAVIRLSDDGGQTNDYPATVTVLGVMPSGTLTTTSSYSWVAPGGTVPTVAMSPGPYATLSNFLKLLTEVKPGDDPSNSQPPRATLNPPLNGGSATPDVLQFTNVTPANVSGLEYHFRITDPDNPGAPVETITDVPTLSLPSYQEGKRYQVEGFVKDSYSNNRSPSQFLNVVVGDYYRGLWGTLARQGQAPPPDASTNFQRIDSNTAVPMQFTIDPAGFGVWPTNTPFRVYYWAQVYDISTSWGSPQRTYLPGESVTGWADGTNNTFTLTVPGSPDYREIDVLAAVMLPSASGPAGVQLGSGGLPGATPGAAAFAVPPTYAMIFRTNQPPSMLTQLINGLKLVRDVVSQLAGSLASVVPALLSNPGRFFDNLFSGLGTAARQVFGQLTTGDGLRNVLFQWLLGPDGGASLSNFSRTTDLSSLASVQNFLLQYAGLTPDHIRQVIQQQLGLGNWAAASRINELLQSLDSGSSGNPPQVLNWLQNLSSDLGVDADALGNFSVASLLNDPTYGLWTVAQRQLNASVGQIVPRLLAKFIPGAGFLQSLYQGLTWLLSDSVKSQIGAFITDFCNALNALANSVTGDPNDSTQYDAYVRGVVNAIQNRGIPLLLSLAMNQLGLGGLPRQLQAALNYIPNRVDATLRQMVASLTGKITARLPGGSASAGSRFRDAIATPANFQYNGQSYTLWVAREQGNVLKVKVWTAGWTDPRVLTARDFNNPGAQAHLQALITAAVAVRNATTTAATVAAQNALTAPGGPLQTVIADIQANACMALNAGCFAAGTQLYTPQGYRNVEDIQVGDLVYARDESDPDGPVVAKVVERKFERTGCILHLHLSQGRLIRTTPEHPFYEQTKGWVAAGALAVGDNIRTDGGWVTVEDLLDTGEYETVYNLRVADYHTYFVGEVEWGFAVWAHNAYTFLSGLKLAQQVANQLTAGGRTLSDADRGAIIHRIEDEGKYGAVGNFDNVVSAVANTISSNGNVGSALQSYFSGTRVRQARRTEESRIDNGNNNTARLSDGTSLRGWTAYIYSQLGDNDARGKSYAAATAEYIDQRGDPTQTNQRMHGHHIVYKDGGTRSPDGRAACKEAKDILLYYGINPYWDRENLIYAPNQGHPAAAIVAIDNRLRTAFNERSSQADVVVVLRQAGTDYFNSALPGVSNYRRPQP